MRAEMPPRWLPAVLLGLLWVADAPTWRNRAARLRHSAQDAGSVRVNNALGTIGFVVGLVSALLVPQTLPRSVTWSGAALAVCGTALRYWAIVTLGPLFTLTIQVRSGQPVVERGPYRWIRHPSYAGADLALLGIEFCSGHWLPAALFVVPWVAAHAYRIQVEERALLATLGDPYARYRERTWRMVPLIW